MLNRIKISGNTDGSFKNKCVCEKEEKKDQEKSKHQFIGKEFIYLFIYLLPLFSYSTIVNTYILPI